MDRSLRVTGIGVLAMSTLLMSGNGSAAPKAEDFLVPDVKSFLALLDLDRAELEPVKEALARDDVEGAGRAYAKYFRSKTVSSPLLTDWPAQTRDPSYNTSSADRALAGYLHDGYSEYHVPESGFDWHNSTLSCVTRFPILRSVRWALHHTHDPKYIRFTVDHILGYMDAYPIAEFAGKSTRQGWTSHTVTAKPWYWCMVPERLMSWSDTLVLIRQFPEVTDAELLSMLHRLYQEAAYLRQEIKSWVDRRHNGGCAMIKALAQACAVLEDFPATREWLDHDGQLVAQYIRQAFYPDGMCVELTTAYSRSVSAMQQRMAHLLREQEAIRSMRDRLEAMITCMVALGDPSGQLPSFGDLYAGSTAGGIHGPLAQWLELPWALALVRGEATPAPPFLVWPLPSQEQWCGYYSMRSDWTPQARYMIIDGGPWGTTHQHGDKLSFVLNAYGAKFVIDPSSTRYAANETDSFISRQVSGFLHNTITIDGVDEFKSTGSAHEAKEPLRNTWEHGERYTLFASSYSFRPVKPVTWERRVVFVDGSYWLLQDVLTGGQDGAEIEQNFQFEADINIEFDGTTTIATAPNNARLLLVPLTGKLSPKLSVGDEAPHVSYWPDGKPKTVLCREDGRDQKHGRGWTGRSRHKLMPAPAVTYTGEETFPLALTIALIPLQPGRPLADTPSLSCTTAESQVHWLLPIREGSLRLTTSLTSCSVGRTD